MTNRNLSYYTHYFTHLKRDMKNGGAPHKPILLLSVIGLFEKGIYTNSQSISKILKGQMIANIKEFDKAKLFSVNQYWERK